MSRIVIALTEKEEAISLQNSLHDAGFHPYIASDSNLMLSRIAAGYEYLIVDLTIMENLDINLPRFIREKNPSMGVIIASDKESLSRAVSISRRENFRYISKPITISDVRFVIDKLKMRGRDEADYFEGRFIGASEKIQKIKAIIKKIARSDSNVMITGETGTGKEVVARSIYELSARSEGPFVAVNSAAIPDNLLESEIFGYKRGAFTGAVGDKKGMIELADNGTLFLDEIADLNLNLQAKLLRVLEYGEFRRLGDENVKKVNIRVLAATNRDLKPAIAKKEFREDLFFRLNVIHIHLPPLRERQEDIPLLIRFFMEKYNRHSGKTILGIDAKARAAMLAYSYPGNIRELENIIQHAFAMCTSDIITIDDLPIYMQNISPVKQLPAFGGPDGADTVNADNDLLLSEVEKATILKAFARFGDNHTKAAKALGISRSTLWRKMKEYGINLSV